MDEKGSGAEEKYIHRSHNAELTPFYSPALHSHNYTVALRVVVICNGFGCCFLLMCFNFYLIFIFEKNYDSNLHVFILRSLPYF